MTTNLTPSDNIQQAIDLTPDGEQFYLSAGVYPLASFAPKPNQRFTALNRDATLSGAQVLTDWARDPVTGYYVHPYTRLPIIDDVRLNSVQSPRASWRMALFLNRVPLYHAGSLTGLPADAYFLNTALQRIYMNADPDNALIQVSHIGSAVDSAVDGLVFEGVTCEHYATGFGIGALNGKSGADGWVVDGCSIQWNASEGLRFRSDATVRNSLFADNGIMGIASNLGVNSQVIHCELARNNWKLSPMDWHAGGSKFSRTVNLLISDVYAHDNYGKGLWGDIANINMSYLDCITVHNLQIGIYHEISEDAIIERCFAGYNTPGGGGGGLYGGQIQVGNSDGGVNGIHIRDCVMIVPTGALTHDEYVGLSIRATLGRLYQSKNIHASNCDVYFTDAVKGRSGYWSSELMEDVTITDMRYHVLLANQFLHTRKNVTGGDGRLPANENSVEILMQSLDEIPVIPAWSLFEDTPDNSGRGRRGRGSFNVGSFGRGRVIGL